MYDAELGAHQAVSEKDVVFAEATPAQRRLAWQLNSESWAQPMTQDQYVEQETNLSRTELTRDGGCKYWVLHMRDDPLAIIGSCESTRKTVFWRRSAVGTNGTVPNGHSAVAGHHHSTAIEEALAYGIASVWTNPTYRRLGMASLMMHRLQTIMDAESAVCSALYSDIGKSYYAQLGWAVFPHAEATLHLLREDRRLAPESCCDVKTRFLERGELRALCDADVADLKARMSRLPDDGRTHVAFAPSHAQIEWHLVGEDNKSAAACPSRGGKPFDRRGAITTDGRSWAIWIRDFKRRQLRVLRIVTTNPDSEARRVDHIWALLGAAVAEASNCGLKSVVVWNPDNTTTSGIKATSNAYQNDVKVVFTIRDGSIPSLRWRGGGDTKKTVWEDNQPYAWC